MDILPVTDSAPTPVPLEIHTDDVVTDANVELIPPTTRRPPGRPRKSRILSRGEIRMKPQRKKHICSRCKASGHNKATCKMPI
ncbi:hypothetical protein IGI04_028536 [Brassica rapa subsp. trilocularis]|uniref:Uncharacterized protein n=1 Tax=Brassica rapa subsp. trilocularis TaxID=1813537 RepID=A0ABQ7L262_BRACM|nr:hypothetical protein IGI04_028536 [Brassica rapa subsp. trilocularis]